MYECTRYFDGKWQQVLLLEHFVSALFIVRQIEDGILLRVITELT